MTEVDRTTVLVRGIGDVGSAIAHALHNAGHAVAIHDAQQATMTRRGMAFADAVFDGEAILEGVMARRVDSVADLHKALAVRSYLTVLTIPFDQSPWRRTSCVRYCATCSTTSASMPAPRDRACRQPR